MKYMIRPLSFLVTPLFMNMGFSANHLTYLGGGVGIISLLFWSLGNYNAWLVGSVLFAIYLVLDAVDGNIARCSDTATYFGKFLDGAIDGLVLSLLSTCIGLGLYMISSEVMWFVVGVATSLVWLAALFVQNRLSFFRDWVKSDYLAGRSATLQTMSVELDTLGLGGRICFVLNYLFVGLIVATVFDLRHLFLVGFLVVSVVWSISLILNQCILASKVLNIHRYSRRSANKGVGR